MAIIPVEEPSTGKTPAGIALFELGFRPFFLAAGIVAAVFLFVFIIGYANGKPVSGYYGLVGWHSHEMIFGYVLAVVAGFLLTAVRNWTGMQTASGGVLAGLVGLWLLARVLPFFSGSIAHGIIAAVDFSFIPVLMVLIAIPLLRGGQKHNLILVVVLALMAVANGLVHSQLLDYSTNTAQTGTDLAIYVLVLLIVIISGRVVPFFIERGTGVCLKRHPQLDLFAIATVVILAAAQVFAVDKMWIAGTALLAMIIHGLRLYSWHHRKLWSVPLLWVLYLAYLWIVTGFALRSLEALGAVPSMITVHAFTVGGMGVMTLGMMSRVALGHTGRALVTGKWLVGAFALVNLAVIARVFLPWFLEQWMTGLLILAAALWVFAFTLFVAVYAPTLIRSRVDGRPG
ncbi:MAG: NnrS family protein [Gammaproteobacteria bacterium]|nr:MAG: NnrS family protein [Gammaproteobacteria bacterium]